MWSGYLRLDTADTDVLCEAGNSTRDGDAAKDTDERIDIDQTAGAVGQRPSDPRRRIAKDVEELIESGTLKALRHRCSKLNGTIARSVALQYCTDLASDLVSVDLLVQTRRQIS